jgi:hypothetical protein
MCRVIRECAGSSSAWTSIRGRGFDTAGVQSLCLNFGQREPANLRGGECGYCGTPNVVRLPRDTEQGEALRETGWRDHCGSVHPIPSVPVQHTITQIPEVLWSQCLRSDTRRHHLAMKNLISRDRFDLHNREIPAKYEFNSRKKSLGRMENLDDMNRHLRDGFNSLDAARCLAGYDEIRIGKPQNRELRTLRRVSCRPMERLKGLGMFGELPGQLLQYNQLCLWNQVFRAMPGECLIPAPQSAGLQCASGGNRTQASV